jgi:YVTN family beta-propeller protein
MRPLLFAVVFLGCGTSVPTPSTSPSSTLAITADDRYLWAVNPDADSLSLIDLKARALVAEVALGPAPARDANSNRYDPAIRPRALALLPGDRKLYVAGQTANRVFVIDTQSRSVLRSIAVGAAPTGIVAAADAVYVVNHEAATVSKIDPASDQVVATLAVGEHPWGAALGSDGRSLYVSQFLLHPGVTVIETSSFTVKATFELAEEPARPELGKLAPNGLPRGVYAVAPRPGTGELWLPHLLLAVNTAQPDLDFQSTVFPTITAVDAKGNAQTRRLLFAPLDVPAAVGAYSDVISGPRALAFTPDGRFALLVNAGSEDVMVFDGERGTEVGLVRPIPGGFLEGIAVDHAGRFAYVDGRNSHNLTVLAIHPADAAAPVVADGDPIERLPDDPMPAELRLGQRLFYTANSSLYPISRNFWVSCSSCHLEGGTDAVTWKFVTGPRDTPSNAGGPINTGFLFRQALRNSVVQYDKTINVEQGGTFHRDDPTQKPLLDALAAFVNYAIPFPQNPNLGAALTDAQTRGRQLFGDRCGNCHSGGYFTDSGSGNPTLDLSGPIVLHDVGTCVTGGPFPDQPAPDDVVGNLHTACDFDVPTLRGIFATAPYFHDGSAASLRDVVDRLPFSADLNDMQKNDLVDYLKTL